MRWRDNIRRFAAVLAAGLAVAGFAAPASAHPHVLITSRSQIVVDGGQIRAVRHSWTFDEAFSAFAIQGLDDNGDGKLSTEELKPLAQINVESLEEYDFFTFLTVGAAAQDTRQFGDPVDYWLDWDGRQLTLNFTLPLTSPLKAGQGPVRLDVYDPEYFIAFTLDSARPAELAGNAVGCTLRVERPKELDDATRAKLAEIPAEMRELPEALYSATSDLANAIFIDCK